MTLPKRKRAKPAKINKPTKPVKAALTKPAKADTAKTPKAALTKPAKPAKVHAPKPAKPAKVVASKPPQAAKVPQVRVTASKGVRVAAQRPQKATPAAKPVRAKLGPRPTVRASQKPAGAGGRQASVAAQVVNTLPSVRPARANRIWLKPAFATPTKPTGRQKKKMLGHLW